MEAKLTIEANFDVSLVASLALREKQIQQNYRPIIAVHKWFARRPGTLFRGLVLSEFGNRPLSDIYFESNSFPEKKVADPFMGGGTPLLEANRVGCDVYGFDINPMAAWIVKEEIEHLDILKYRNAANKLLAALRLDLADIYKTDCPRYGDRNVPVKYFLWVKTLDCAECGKNFDLFPGYLLADDTRHPEYVLVCKSCGELNEVADVTDIGACRCCASTLSDEGPARRSKCKCPHCEHVNSYPRPASGPPRHRMFAIEYFNPNRRKEHKGRFFKKPDEADLARYAQAAARWQETVASFVPNQAIPSGDETDRLHRWGYKRYREMFNDRQLLGLEKSCSYISSIPDERIRHALATNLSDLLRYQNMLCRYDTMALKSLDIFSVHGFPVGLVQCESNLLGIAGDNGASVGSGGWSNILDKYEKAKRYCDEPFEVKSAVGKKHIVHIPGEWIGEAKNGQRPRSVSIRCASSTSVDLADASLDAVLTDPPYFGNVQYGELMNFCYVWLRNLVGQEAEGFDRDFASSPDELTGNATQSRGLDHFADGLSQIYSAMARALKPGAPLAFTFHHNRIEPYHAIAVAILDAGLTCYAALPCPAEMGGSIHIHGTGSSIIDTVFVCRTHGRASNGQDWATLQELADVIRGEVKQLQSAGVKPTAGDIRCIVFGHVARAATLRLREEWDVTRPMTERLSLVAKECASVGSLGELIALLAAEGRGAMTELTSNKVEGDAVSV